MTAFLIWLRNRAAALLATPAAAITNINLNHGHPAPTTCATPAEQSSEAFFGSKKDGLIAGQEVRLISDDVWMTVLYADCCEADCAWFEGRTMHRDTFPLACLTTATPMPF